MRFLNDDIMLFVFCNPDGEDLVANWYMREPEPTKRADAQRRRGSGPSTSATTTTATST